MGGLQPARLEALFRALESWPDQAAVEQGGEGERYGSRRPADATVGLAPGDGPSSAPGVAWTPEAARMGSDARVRRQPGKTPMVGTDLPELERALERLLDLKDLQIFVRAADLHSLSAAAQALCIPKSTASRSLQRLEQRIGAPLLRRTNRRLVLTETGELLHRHALRILGEVEQAETEVSRVSGAPRGLLRVTAPLTFGRAFVAPLLPDFLAAHPEIQLSLELTPGGVDPFGSNVDVAVRVGPLEDSQLHARKLGVPEVWLCASPRYLELRGTPKQPADLALHDVLDWSPPHGGSEWALVGAEGVEKLQVAPRLTVNDSSVLRVAAIAGTGIGWIPAFLCDADLRRGRLRRVLPEWRREPFEVYAIFPGGRALSPKVRAFVEFLVERLRVRALDPDGAAAGGLDDLVG